MADAPLAAGRGSLLAEGPPGRIAVDARVKAAYLGTDAPRA
mgnify:CR=1 FL=1